MNGCRPRAHEIQAPLSCSRFESVPIKAGHEPFVSSQEGRSPNREGGGRDATTQGHFSFRLGARARCHEPSGSDGGGQGTDRPLTGSLASTTTVNLVTLTGTIVSSGELSHLGTVTDSQDAQFALVGPNGFSWTGTDDHCRGQRRRAVHDHLGAGTLGPPIQIDAVQHDYRRHRSVHDAAERLRPSQLARPSQSSDRSRRDITSTIKIHQLYGTPRSGSNRLPGRELYPAPHAE